LQHPDYRKKFLQAKVFEVKVFSVENIRKLNEVGTDNTVVW